MATEFIFGAIFSTDGGGVNATGDNGQPITEPRVTTIEATDDDGMISAFDTVTITGLPEGVTTLTSIAEGATLTYYGAGTFQGLTGYVFGVPGTLPATGEPLIVLFDENFLDVPFDVLTDVADFGADTSTQALTTAPACFAKGTEIATPNGPRPVESLAIGDPILTADGRTVPVRWIGRQTVSARFAGDRARPIRVAAGALGHRLPHTDLILTADHALILQGLAITAGALVNGTTITRDPAPDRATYYHVETEDHDVILANGAAAETFVDYIGRAAFDNYAEYRGLYGDTRAITEMTLPRISSARLLPANLRAELAA